MEAIVDGRPAGPGAAAASGTGAGRPGGSGSRPASKRPGVVVTSHDEPVARSGPTRRGRCGQLVPTRRLRIQKGPGLTSDRQSTDDARSRQDMNVSENDGRYGRTVVGANRCRTCIV